MYYVKSDIQRQSGRIDAGPFSTYGLSIELLASITGAHLRTVRRWKRAGIVPRHFADIVSLRTRGDLGILSDDWRGFTLRKNELWTPHGWGPVRPGDINAIPLRMQHLRELERQTECAQQTSTADMVPSRNGSYHGNRDESAAANQRTGHREAVLVLGMEAGAALERRLERPLPHSFALPPSPPPGPSAIENASQGLAAPFPAHPLPHGSNQAIAQRKPPPPHDRTATEVSHDCDQPLEHASPKQQSETASPDLQRTEGHQSPLRRPHGRDPLRRLALRKRAQQNERRPQGRTNQTRRLQPEVISPYSHAIQNTNLPASTGPCTEKPSANIHRQASRLDHEPVHIRGGERLSGLAKTDSYDEQTKTARATQREMSMRLRTEIQTMSRQEVSVVFDKPEESSEGDSRLGAVRQSSLRSDLSASAPSTQKTSGSNYYVT